ncbi:Putative helicase [Olavius algarvensis Delta 1 endosymbiont]|nr:Putative helicase [Olavius algarvensis Delta 1 endosymbiont]
MQNKNAETEINTSPDLSLLLAKIEADVLEGKESKECRLALSTEGLWKSAASCVLLKLAKLAQMSGEADGALKVLAHINQASPDLVEPWIERIDLLSILGRKQEVAKVLAASRKYIGQSRYDACIKTFKDSVLPGLDTDFEAETVPFERLHRRQQAIAKYLELFSGRSDCFARQWVDKANRKQGYVPVRRSMTAQDVEDHLSGRKTYGIYLMQTDACVKTAVLDADLNKKFRQSRLNADDKSILRRERHYLISRVRELAGEMGLKPLTEFSGGKGFHFWFFFNPPAEAALARQVLNRLKDALCGDLSAFGLEVFPKQDGLSGKGLGNLVKMPLGIHRLAGKRSFFVECRDQECEAQLKVLETIEPVDAASLRLQGNESEPARVVVHPRWQKWAEDFPELYQLENVCPPFAQIIAVCREGGGLSVKEEKVIYQTLGFLPRAKTLLHYLVALLSDYNPHLVDFKLSRIRGTPLGCRRIHTLLGYDGEFCRFEPSVKYFHPLLHLDQWQAENWPKAEKVENLSAALDNLDNAIAHVKRFLK